MVGVAVAVVFCRCYLSPLMVFLVQLFLPTPSLSFPLPAEEFGRDLEHVEVLQKKFDEFQKDMANNEDRVAEVNQTADTLIMEQHPDGDAIQKKREVRGWIPVRRCYTDDPLFSHRPL